MNNDLMILDDNCPKELIVSTNGPAKIWKKKLGKYKLQNYDVQGNAVYTHAPNNGYLLYKVKGPKHIWMVCVFLEATIFCTTPFLKKMWERLKFKSLILF